MSLSGILELGPEYRWDDLRAPATSIPLQGQSGDPDRATDGTLLYDAASAEQSSIIYQLPHSWEAGTGLRFHLHWSKTTDAAGDVAWQMRYRLFNNGEISPAWSAWIDADNRSKEPGSTQTVVIDAFPELDMTGKRASCMASIQFRRNATAAADTYAADARLWDADCHYRIGDLGSEEEYPA